MRLTVPPDAAGLLAMRQSVALAFVGLLRWKWEVVPVVVASGLLGLVYKLIFS